MARGSRAVRAGRAFVEFFLEDGALRRGIKTAERRMRQFGVNVRNYGRQAMMYGLAGIAALTLPVNQFINFDDAIRMTGAVSQSTAAELESLRANALELGRTTSFTAVEVARLMGELGRAGFKSDEINSMTTAVLNLARASGTDAVLASGIMAASLRQFGLGASEAARVANVLTLAANSTFNSVESLGESLSYAGPVAADLGMSLEDTVAILGTLGNVGIQGSNAGTALRRLVTMTGAEAEKMKEIFGVEFLDAAGNIRPLVDTLGDLAAATNHLPTGERAQKLHEAFGLLGITGASVISNAAADTRKLANELKTVGNVAAETAEMMDAGAGGAWRRLTSSVEGAAIALGTALAPAMIELAQYITETTGEVTAWITANGDLVTQIAQGLLYLTGFGAAAIAAGYAIGFLSSVLGLVGTVLGIVTTALSICGTVISLVAGAASALAGILAGVSLPAVAVATALGAVAAALAAGSVWWLHSSGAIAEVTNQFADLTSFLGSSFLSTWDLIIGRIRSGDFAGALGFVWEVAKATWAIGIAELQLGWQRFGGSLLQGLHGIMTTVEEVWNQFWSSMYYTVAEIWAGIKDTINAISDYANAAMGRQTFPRKSNSEKLADQRRADEDKRQEGYQKSADELAAMLNATEEKKVAATESARQKLSMIIAAEQFNQINQSKALAAQTPPAPTPPKPNPTDQSFANVLKQGSKQAQGSQSLAADAILVGTIEGQQAILEAIGLKQTDATVSAIQELGATFEDEFEKTRRENRDAPRLAGSRKS